MAAVSATAAFFSAQNRAGDEFFASTTSAVPATPIDNRSQPVSLTTLRRQDTHRTSTGSSLDLTAAAAMSAIAAQQDTPNNSEVHKPHSLQHLLSLKEQLPDFHPVTVVEDPDMDELVLSRKRSARPAPALFATDDATNNISTGWNNSMNAGSHWASALPSSSPALTGSTAPNIGWRDSFQNHSLVVPPGMSRYHSASLGGARSVQYDSGLRNSTPSIRSNRSLHGLSFAGEHDDTRSDRISYRGLTFAGDLDDLQGERSSLNHLHFKGEDEDSRSDRISLLGRPFKADNDSRSERVSLRAMSFRADNDDSRSERVSLRALSLKGDNDDARSMSLRGVHFFGENDDARSILTMSSTGGGIDHQSHFGSGTRIFNDESSPEEYFIPKSRSKTKSTSSGQDSFMQFTAGASIPEVDAETSDAISIGSVRSIWEQPKSAASSTLSAPLITRRSATQPRPGLASPTPDQQRLAQVLAARLASAPPIPSAQLQSLLAQDAAAAEAAKLNSLMMEKTNQFRQHRTGNSSPQAAGDIQSQLVTSHQGGIQMERRHSAAAHGRLHANLHSIPDKENFDVEDPIYADVNDYFENTEYRTKALQLAASNSGNNNKPLPATPTQHTWPLFAIEFKAGRIEYFYLPEQSMSVGAVKTGDLVLVEADRGKDLGKVAFDSIMNHEELAEFRMQHPDATATVTSSDGGVVARDLQPKRIIRRAIQSEVALLVLKSQDEAKAMGVCQTKIRQKKLPMEVVDAEFQWDRRKLTFYFVADRRIDFRELVRDLFKLYKTRIWMCAVNPSKLAR